MSDLKSGSSHMRLIFKVKKGQLSMSFTQPPYYYGYIFPEYLLNQ